MQRAQAVVALGYPAVEPILPELLLWAADRNWPIAGTLEDFLATIGLPLLPHIYPILNNSDEPWKYNLLMSIVRDSSELVQALRTELERLASAPTPSEREEELDETAREILEEFPDSRAWN